MRLAGFLTRFEFAIATGAIAASLSTTPADAGGLAVREQSASAIGSAFAGSAAGYDPSSMFWNPAAAGAQPITLNASTEASVDILSVSMKFKLGGHQSAALK